MTKMQHHFQVQAIEAPTVQHFFELDDQQLAAQGALRKIVDQKPGFPCRISLKDAEIGEEVILFPYAHHTVDSPYQASGPVFIRRGVATASLALNELPEMLWNRYLSLRAYDNQGMMIDARTIHGAQLSETIQQVFDLPSVIYIQVHNAGPGCYNCQINRVIQ